MEWMTSVQLTPLKQTLKRILLQTVESLGDSQWELRRITKQVSRLNDTILVDIN